MLRAGGDPGARSGSSTGTSRARLCPSPGLAAAGGAALRGTGRFWRVPWAGFPRVPRALRRRRERLPAVSSLPPIPGGGDCKQRDTDSELEKSEFCSIHGPVKELLHLHEEPAAGLTNLPGPQEATCHKQGDATCERAVSEDVENAICSRRGRVREPLGPQDTSAPGHVHRNILRRLPGEWFSCHPVLTSALIVLLVLVLALAVALAVQSAPELPVPPACPPLVLGCPSGWVGYNGVCYYLSNDSRSWEQSQERCSELGASLAILKEEEMDLFFRLRGNGDYWLGLRSRGEQLQWEDGSSFSSSVPVIGYYECVCLADNVFRSVNCSNLQPYLCSKARAPL